MLQPSRQKYRKMQKGRNKGIATTGNKVSFGDFGLKAVGRGRLTARQIEAARRVMTRHIKRGGRVWIRIFPDQPISKKPRIFTWSEPDDNEVLHFATEDEILEFYYEE